MEIVRLLKNFGKVDNGFRYVLMVSVWMRKENHLRKDLGHYIFGISEHEMGK